MTDDRQGNATPTTKENANNISMADRNGNTNLIKVEQVGNAIINITDHNETTTPIYKN